MLRRPARVRLPVTIGLAGLSILVAASWLAATAAHVDDGYAVDHVSGTWIALARYANAGTLYPRLFDGHVFGGTRFMPVPIVLQAGAARVSGEYLVSAKLLSFVLVAALLALTFALIRRTGCPTAAALALTSTILVTGTGLSAALSIRNDALPLILQLVAVALVARSASRRTVGAAGGLCALALLSKLSAVWAPLAIGIWLVKRDRRALAVFAGGLVAALAIGLAGAQAASHGRMFENVVGLSVAGAGRIGPLHEQVSRWRLIAREGVGWLAPLLAVGVPALLLAARRRRLTLYHVAYACALAVTAVVLVDPGAYVNQLLDLQVLSLVVVGELWSRVSLASGRTALLPIGLAAALLAGSVADYRQNVAIGADLRTLFQGTTASADTVPRLAGSVRPSDRVLSEDPFVPVSRGQRPVVLDPFMLLTIVRRHPAWQADLIGRIEHHEFDKVILLYRPQSAPSWYRRIHLGEPIVRAIEHGYRPSAEIDGEWIYVPSGRSGRSRRDSPAKTKQG